MVKFFYLYILQSELDVERFYTGLTHNLIERFSLPDFRGWSGHRPHWHGFFLGETRDRRN